MVDTNSEWQFEELARVLETRQTQAAPLEYASIRVAEWKSPNTPTPIAFREVVTQELSTGNIVFVDQVVPRTHKMILAIDTPAQPKTVFLIVEVASVEELKVPRGSLFVVRCQFVELLKHRS